MKSNKINICHSAHSVLLSLPSLAWCFSDRMPEKHKADAWQYRQKKNLYLCTFVKNKDTRTEEHKANAMKNNQINICHSAHSVLLSLPSQTWLFFRQNDRMKHKWLTHGDFLDRMTEKT